MHYMEQKLQVWEEKMTELKQTRVLAIGHLAMKTAKKERRSLRKDVKTFVDVVENTEPSVYMAWGLRLPDYIDDVHQKLRSKLDQHILSIQSHLDDIGQQ